MNTWPRMLSCSLHLHFVFNSYLWQKKTQVSSNQSQFMKTLKEPTVYDGWSPTDWEFVRGVEVQQTETLSAALKSGRLRFCPQHWSPADWLCPWRWSPADWLCPRCWSPAAWDSARGAEVQQTKNLSTVLKYSRLRLCPRCWTCCLVSHGARS